MATSLELSIRLARRSEFTEELIRDRVSRLEQLYDGITSCHVSVSAPHQKQRTGQHYEISLEIRVPGTELAVSHNTGQSDAHEAIHVAIRDAFNAMERQLVRWKDKRRRHVKAHSDQPRTLSRLEANYADETDMTESETFEPVDPDIDRAGSDSRPS